MPDDKYTVKFRLTKDEYSRSKKYVPIDGSSMPVSYWAHIAYREWLTRKESRDKRAKEELLVKDVNRIQEILDSGKIKIPKGIIS